MNEYEVTWEAEDIATNPFTDHIKESKMTIEDTDVCMNAELQHEIDAVETARKLRDFFKKIREEKG